MATDQFCLRWNNFQSNIVTALDSLKTEEDLVDVTLVCEAHAVKAHKVILSACSPYFRNVFKENPCQHPVVILKDVSAEDVEALLSFMYQGEVYISQERLPSFLRTAELLQVRGLTGASAPSNALPLSDVPSPVQQTSSTPSVHPPSVPALRPSSSHHKSSKVHRSAGSPPPLSVLPVPSSAVTTSSKQSEGSPQAKRRKAVPRRVPITPSPEELSVVTKQEPFEEDEMGLCHEEDIKPVLSGDEDLDDGDSSRQHGITTSASQSPLASDESTSMLARSLTAPRNSDASGSHSPVQTSQYGILEPSSNDQLSPDNRTGENRMCSRPCPVCFKIISNKSNLVKHMRIKHGGTYLQEVACHLCGKVFKHKYSLSAHIYSLHRQFSGDDHEQDAQI